MANFVPDEQDAILHDELDELVALVRTPWKEESILKEGFFHVKKKIRSVKHATSFTTLIMNT